MNNEEQILLLLQNILQSQGETNHRLGLMESQLDHVDQRLKNVEKRLDSVEIRLDSMEKRMDSVEIQLNGVEDRLVHVEGQLAETIQICQAPMHIVEVVNAKIDGFDLRMAGLEGKQAKTEQKIALLEQIAVNNWKEVLTIKQELKKAE